MLQNILEAGISNVAVASVMAFIVFAITRVWKNPHVTHLLWLLVLIKLVSPPLWHISIPVPHISAHFSADEGTTTLKHTEGQTNISEPESLVLEEIGPLSGHLTVPILNNGLPHIDESALAKPGFELMARSQASPLPVGPSVLPRQESQENRPAYIPTVPDQTPLWWMIPTLVWLVGSFVWIIGLSFRILHFNRLIHQTLPATVELKSVAKLIATKLSFRRLPELRLTEAAMSPLVWPIANPPIVVLPKRLVDGMDDNQLATIVSHEFAHLRRADHWVRFLEVVVISLYWWNPIVWWVCHELRAAEEACCDALVLRMYPEQLADYGEALLRTNEFIMSGQIPSPVLASEFGHSCSLKRRVEMILKNEFGKPASPVVKIMIVALALGLMPMAARVALSQKDVSLPPVNTNSELTLDTNTEVEHNEDLPVPQPVTVRIKPSATYDDAEKNENLYRLNHRIQVKVEPTDKGHDLDEELAPLPQQKLKSNKPKRNTRAQPTEEDSKEDEYLLKDDIALPQTTLTLRADSKTLEKRVERMESLLEKILTTQTRKNVPVQKQMQPPHLPIGGPTGLSKHSIRYGAPATRAPLGLPGQIHLSFNQSSSRSQSGKEVQGLGDSVVIERIVKHLQHEKSGRALILKKQAEIERLTKEVAQLKAAFEQIEQLKAALKKAEETKAKSRY